jgi:4-hydroxy-2-oxoheptanedioate aldolase
VQIETPQGLAVADEIAAIPGIDGLYIGPQDLRIRMQHVPENERYSTQAATEKIAEICKRHHKAWGSLPSSVPELSQHAALGSQLLVWGLDSRMIQEGLTRSSQELNQLIQENS